MFEIDRMIIQPIKTLTGTFPILIMVNDKTYNTVASSTRTCYMCGATSNESNNFTKVKVMDIDLSKLQFDVFSNEFHLFYKISVKR